MTVISSLQSPCAAPAKPDWIRVKAPQSQGYKETRQKIRDAGLHPVCEEAACPNIGECWTKKHATVMILGDTCTRACRFCNVKTGKPQPVDEGEPDRLVYVFDAIKQTQRMKIARPRANARIQARHGFGVVIEDVRPGLYHGFKRAGLAHEIGRKYFDRRAGVRFANGANATREMLCAAVGQIVAINRRNDDMLKP